MVTQVNSSSLAATSQAPGNVTVGLESAARARPSPNDAPPPRDALANVDRGLALSSMQEGLANAATALDVALRFGKQAFAELTTGEARSPAQLADFAAQLRAADALSGGLLTGGSLNVRTSPEGGTVEIEGVDVRALGADAESVKTLSAALARFASAADKLTAHARLAATTLNGLQGVSTDLDADQARLTALDAAQGLRGVSPAIANASPLSLLAFFQS